MLSNSERGVTLIELVIGITVLAVALTLITAVLSPLFVRSTDPWHQVRAAELGHSLMNSMLAFPFDDIGSFSAEGENILILPLPEELSGAYRNYKAEVTVGYVDADLQPVSGPSPLKHIKVEIITPTEAKIAFSAYRGNW